MRRIVAIALGLVALSVLVGLMYRYWYQPTYDFVETDDALVTGNLARVGAPANGRIDQLFVNVGDTLNENDVIATIQVVSAAPGASVSGPTISRILARVTSPVSGKVAARWVNTGDSVAAGQVLFTISELNNLWVIANVDQLRVNLLSPGQPADVKAGAPGQTFVGKVVQVGSATTEVISPPAIGGLTSSDSTKKIPVRVAVDWKGAAVVPGMTVEVTIRIR